jgi:hypothetical protein
MATQQLQRAQWAPYFDRVSRRLGAAAAQIETASLSVGDQINRKWATLNGLAYDPKDDIFEVATDDLDHLIAHPREIYVEEAGALLHSVDIVDAAGNHQIVKLREPLLLPTA